MTTPGSRDRYIAVFESARNAAFNGNISKAMAYATLAQAEATIIAAELMATTQEEVR